MQKLPGILCLAIGGSLTYWGHSMAQSIGGQLQNTFTGSPGDKPMWLYIAGSVLIIIGLGQIVWKQK